MKCFRLFHKRLASFNEQTPRDRGPHILRQTSQCDPHPPDVLGPQTGKYEHLEKPETVMALPQYTVCTHLYSRPVWKLSFNEV